MKPKASIIMPVYNVEKYLETNLQYLLASNISDKEVIIIDDGSTDNSFAVAESYQRKFPDKIILLKKENGGPSAARNYGLKHAKGDYIFFIDSDDIVHGDIIDKMINEADSSLADIVIADYYEFSENTGKKFRFDKSSIAPLLITEEERLMPLFEIKISFAVWNKMYRRNFLNANGLEFLDGFLFEDLDFIFRSFYSAKKIIKIPETLYGYRQRAGSIMKSITPKILDKIAVMDKLAIFLQEKGKFNVYRDFYGSLYFKMALSVLYSCLKHQSDKNVTKLIIDEVFKAPNFKKILLDSAINLELLTSKEKIAYFLIKKRIVNPSILLIARSII